MKILITNDDSIKSIALLELAKAAKNYGEVFIVAPSDEQSGKSHGIDIKNGLELTKASVGLDCDTYTLTSTPADCVRAAVFALKRDFDIVFSGINTGLNVGEDIAYSGTVAAISEAAMLGKKGIAFSAYANDHNTLIKYFDEIMEFFKTNKLLEYNDLYNVNVPRNPKGIKLTRQGSTHFDTRFDNINGMYYQLGNPRHEMDKDNENSDVFAIYNEYISITPLINDRTNYEILKKFNISYNK